MPPSPSLPTQVCITIDVECSIAGAFTWPDRYIPISNSVVDCVVEGREHGVGLMLDLFAEHQIPATFFVEALNHHYFGDVPMGRVARRIAADGHDVELHLHPCWTTFADPKWRDGIRLERPNDRCAGRSLAEMIGFIDDGIRAFERWGVAPPLALRTGGLLTDRTVYRAMRHLGMPLASNVGVATHQLPDASLHLFAGRHWIEGVLEIPVLTYFDPANVRLSHKHARRPLQIASTSWAETRGLLWKARRQGVSPVVMLTHPFELVKATDFRYDKVKRNRVTQRRLRRLCEFLARHRDDFEPVGFRAGYSTWCAAGPTANVPFTTSRGRSLARSCVNVANDVVWML